MNTLKKLLMAAVVASTCATANSSELLNNAMQSWEFQQYQAQLKQEIIDTHNSYQTYIKESGQVHTMAPAAPLSSFEIRGAISTQYPQWEFVTESAFSTSQNHGGNELYIVTREVGYANPASRLAKINGSNLSIIDTQPVTSGNLVVGYLVIWKYPHTNFTSGSATASARSINFPNNLEDDRLYIR
ncbi:DUF4879 domain-containing protein [Pseudoalteromonas sp. MMG013]|uniref:DUF4879 domain-containing protein n=1 Tax=Pseudoalteromonas sp. MMG013 TaxID=2822687 RepID=UPI001B38175F|nr:DUF4879 domain-containing protein [Pseudoalteromonas sp. MMG013]MBQ4864732.1 DUF4879 domain-containing protein [Pseudoalteromonas sp. MMG013]